MSIKKYLIGLTVNIATGKSAVLRMLRRLGARVIDADALVHQLMVKGTPVWQAILDEFGEGILRPKGEIDREKLGAIVFADAKALKRLEAIVHPAVTARVDELIRQATEPVVVVEAIVKKGLSVRQTEEMVRRMASGAQPRRRDEPPSPETEALENEFRNALGTKVKLFRSKKGGKLVIQFYSEEELEAIYRIIVGGDRGG